MRKRIPDEKSAATAALAAMNYRESWNLATIPEDKLKSEWARRNVLKKGKKDVDPERRAYLDKKADSMRKLRASRAQGKGRFG
jgi:hypothetical protein